MTLLQGSSDRVTQPHVTGAALPSAESGTPTWCCCCAAVAAAAAAAAAAAPVDLFVVLLSDAAEVLLLALLRWSTTLCPAVSSIGQYITSDAAVSAATVA